MWHNPQLRQGYPIFSSSERPMIGARQGNAIATRLPNMEAQAASGQWWVPDRGNWFTCLRSRQPRANGKQGTGFATVAQPCGRRTIRHSRRTIGSCILISPQPWKCKNDHLRPNKIPSCLIRENARRENNNINNASWNGLMFHAWSSIKWLVRAYSPTLLWWCTCPGANGWLSLCGSSALAIHSLGISSWYDGHPHDCCWSIKVSSYTWSMDSRGPSAAANSYT